MPNESREARADASQVLLPWGMPSTERHEDVHGSIVLWLAGGFTLLAWTGVALLLTSA